MLRVEDLVAGYEPGLPIVNGARLQASAGEIVAVLGPNGAGKSTLVKAVAGLAPVFSGRVLVDGEDVTGRPAHTLVRRRLAYVPQYDNVFALMTVDDNLKLAAAVLPKLNRTVRAEAVYDFFPDLARQRMLLAGRLSGGQRQMLAVARALVVEPKVLILDEASAGLAPKLVEQLFAKVKEIGGTGAAIVIVEQNVHAALGIADRAYVLVDGRNRFEGAAADLWADPAIGRLYLGAADEAAALGAA